MNADPIQVSTEGVAKGSPDPTVRLVGLRRMALLLAVAGLVLLHRAARLRDLPWVTGDRLTPAMQFAPVRAAGNLAEAPRVYRREGQVNVVSFVLDNQGEALNVVAFGETARELAGAVASLNPGARLEITGVVQFSPRYGAQIHLRHPEHVTIVDESTGASL